MFRVIGFCLALLVPGLAAAQCNGTSFLDTLTAEDRAALTAQSEATPFATGNYWRATRDGKTLWILGTMHLPDPRHDAILQRIAPQLATADLLLVEATLEDQSAMQTHMATNPDLMTLPDGLSLPALLDAPTWDALSEAAAARGLPGFMAARMQPWFLGLTLAIPPCALASMTAGDLGLDAQIMTKAQTLGLPTEPLEPWQDMFALLSSGTLEEQLAALRLAVFDPALQDAVIVATVDAYFAETSALAWFMTTHTFDHLNGVTRAEFDAQFAELEDLLLIQRNANWIPVIETAAAQNDTVFVAFGAAHLFADTGVLALLEQNGWALTRQ